MAASGGCATSPGRCWRRPRSPARRRRSSSACWRATRTAPATGYARELRERPARRGAGRTPPLAQRAGRARERLGRRRRRPDRRRPRTRTPPARGALALPEPECRRTGTAEPHAEVSGTPGPGRRDPRGPLLAPRTGRSPGASGRPGRGPVPTRSPGGPAWAELPRVRTRRPGPPSRRSTTQRTTTSTTFSAKRWDTLEDWWLPALESEREPPLFDTLSPPQAGYLLSRLPTRKLERLPSHSLTDRAVIHRADAGMDRQRQALANLTAGTSRFVSLTPAVLLVGELQRLDAVPTARTRDGGPDRPAPARAGRRGAGRVSPRTPGPRVRRDEARGEERRDRGPDRRHRRRVAGQRPAPQDRLPIN